MGGNKDVSYHAPNADDWAAYEDSLERLSEFKTPKLFDAIRSIKPNNKKGFQKACKHL